MKPLNIYYHFFSGEQAASLRAVQDVYAWALKQETSPMFTSQYLRMMQGYMTARIIGEAPGSFAVENYGDCLTFRMPAASPAPDLRKSVNVLGYHRAPQGLYISLAPGQSRARIVTAANRPGGDIPHIHRATGGVANFQSSRGDIRMRCDGFGKGWIELGGLTPGRDYEAGGDALGGGRASFRADSRGIARIQPITTGGLTVQQR